MSNATTQAYRSASIWPQSGPTQSRSENPAVAPVCVTGSLPGAAPGEIGLTVPTERLDTCTAPTGWRGGSGGWAVLSPTRETPDSRSRNLGGQIDGRALSEGSTTVCPQRVSF